MKHTPIPSTTYPVTGPSPRMTWYQKLALKAREHIDAGGCSGDLCPTCDGMGFESYPSDRNTAVTVVDRCGWCKGSGLGR